MPSVQQSKSRDKLISSSIQTSITSLDFFDDLFQTLNITLSHRGGGGGGNLRSMHKSKFSNTRME